VSLEDVCRPGPVFHPPPLALRDSSDYSGPGQRAPTLTGEDVPLEEIAVKNREEEKNFQDDHYSDGAVTSETTNLERILPVNGSQTPPVLGSAPQSVGERREERDKWRCEYPSCGRLFQKRHELK
jgi:hypothetical protein